MKQNKKKIGLALTGVVAASGAVTGALVGLASCANNTTIPTQYLKTENGLVTGFISTFTDEQLKYYTTLSIPEKDSNGNAITGIAENAFKNKFKKAASADDFDLNQIIIKKNVKTIGKNAFYGCNAIARIDLSDFDTAHDIYTLFADANMGQNAFAVANTRQEGKLVLNKNIVADEEINGIKTCLLSAGLPKTWFKSSEQPTVEDLRFDGESTSVDLKGKRYNAGEDANTWKVYYGKDTSTEVSTDCAYSIIPLSLNFPTDKIAVVKEQDGRARVKWSNTLAAGQYLFELKATYTRAGGDNFKAISDSILLTVENTTYTISTPASLTGKNYKPEAATEKCSTKVDTQTVDSTYSIVDPTSDQIFIDNTGTINWGELATGNYYFKVKSFYTYKDAYGNTTKLEATSNQIVLSISSRVVYITNAKFEEGYKELEAGYTKEPFTAEVRDNSYNSTKWTLHMLSGPSLEALKMTDEYPGYVYWDENIPAGTYTFYVTANVDGKWFGNSSTITVTFGQKEATISGGETQLQSYDYTPGEGKTRAMYVDGRLVENATWSIEGPHPSGIKINSQGQITWDDTLPEGEYSFKVKGHSSGWYGHERNAYQDVKLIVGVKTYTISGGSFTLNTDEYQWGQDSKNWVANAPVTGNDTVEWSLQPIPGQMLPSGLNINDNGTVWWSEDLPAGTYDFYVCALINNHWHGRTTSTVTLNVAQRNLKIEDSALPSTIKTKDYTSGITDEKATVNLIGYNAGTTIDVTSSTKFSLINQGTVGLPSSLKVTQDGKISWGDDIGPGTYKFSIGAQYEYHGRTISTSTTKVITLEVEAVVIEVKQTTKTKNFKGDVNAPKIDRSIKFSVEKDGAAYTKPVTWHFTDITGETPVLLNKIRITDDGYLSWDAIPAGKYKFYVWCEVENKWWGYLHDTATTGLEITLEITAEHDLVNGDLLKDQDGKVIGLATDVSGYTSEHSLTIEVDGTTVTGITSLVGIANNEVITSLVIKTTADLTLDGLQGSPMFGLTNLKSIKIENTAGLGKTVTIGQYAFPNSTFATCTTLDLTGVDIDQHAFSQWTALTKVTLTSIPKIGIGAFYQAGATTGMEVEGLKSILAFGTPTELGTNVFDGSNIKYTGELNISRDVIPEYTFTNCALFTPDITFDANHDIEIKKEAFSYSMIKTVTFKDIDDKVAENAFTGCLALSKLTFTTRIDYIGASAFSNCSALKTIDVSSIDAGTDPSTKYKIATLANDMDANAFVGMAEGGTFICKDQNTAATFKENLYSKLPTWTYTNNGAWRLTSNISKDVTLSTTLPQLIRYDERLYIPYTVAAGKQVVPYSSYVQINGQMFYDDKGAYAGIVEISYGYILINMPEVIKITGEIQERFPIHIKIVTQDEETLEYTGSKQVLAEQTGTSGPYTTVFRGFKVNDKVNIDDLRIEGHFKKDGSTFSRSNYSLSVINVDKAAGTFDIQMSINEDAGTGVGGYKLDGFIRIADANTHVYWDITDLQVYVDYHTQTLTNADFNVDGNGIMTGLKTALASDCYYNIEIELDGTTHKNLGPNILNTVTNGNMIDTINITNKSANTQKVTLISSMFAACTDLRHIKLVNESSTTTNLEATSAFLPDACQADLLDIEVDNVALSHAFKDFNAVSKVIIGNGTYLGEDSFENMSAVELLDLSSWDAVPTGANIWHKDSFSNFAMSLLTTHKMKVKNQQMMELWTKFFKDAEISGIEPDWWIFYW